MTSMPRVFLIFFNFWIFFKTFVPFKILSHYPNIDSSQVLNELEKAFNGSYIKASEKSYGLNGFDILLHVSTKIFGFRLLLLLFS